MSGVYEAGSSEGVPVFGRDDVRLGVVSGEDIRAGLLRVRHGVADEEAIIPTRAILWRDAGGVYTNLSWDDVVASLPPARPGSGDDMLSAFATGAEGAHADSFTNDPPT
jgi:hypothetical protein